ncbi:MAG: hypothetical protein IPM92_11030 [Saprospiraceae bacterium]|nr:hypothetical protein [Saprospiraceae bacterium]
MKIKEIEQLESHFKTGNEHRNKYVLEMLCDVIKQGNFEILEMPLLLFDKAINIFALHHKTPLRAIQDFEDECDKQKLIPDQKLFVYEWVCKFLKNTDFKGIDLMEVLTLLNSKTERLKNDKPQIEYTKPLTRNIRESLKEFIQRELELLPETLKDHASLQRLSIICKLLPFVLPKVENVIHKLGEPDEFKVRRYHD